MKTKKKQSTKAQMVSFQDWLADFYGRTGIAIEHGDYQRIASLVKRKDGKPFTADYVRKVLLGLRNNSRIYKAAQRYLRMKQKLYEGMPARQWTR